MEYTKESKLTDFFKLYGPWEDTRDVETIIADTQNSRISKAGISLCIYFPIPGNTQEI
jgi:hypothetical protein